MKNGIKMKNNKIYKNLIGILKKNKFFWSLIIFIFILHLLTYPSIHNIGDEQLYLDVASRICKLDFSDFTGRETARVHGPFYHSILCLTSPFHHFEIEKAEIVNFIFVIIGIVGWYFSTSFLSDETRKRLIILLFANSLIWIYSFRVLIDVSIGVFLSLGLINSYLFLEYRKKRNYYLTIIFISLASLTSEIAISFIPILFVFLLLKKDKNFIDWSMLILPFIPYGVYQLSIGFKDVWVFGRGLGIEGRLVSFVPYSHLPIIVFTIGIFGPGIISCILMWKNINQEKKLKNFLIFSLLLYLLWEFFFDFVISYNLPRLHITLMPFLTLLLAEASTKSKSLRYVYYITLVYMLMTGFLAAYYFHVNELPIWKNQIIDITKMIKIN